MRNPTLKVAGFICPSLAGFECPLTTGDWKRSRRRILVTAAFVPLGVELVRLVEEISKLSFR
jgi:hypothetical protein